MTAKVYETSTVMAEKLGTFKNYEENKVPMMEVMNMHRDSLRGVQVDSIPDKFKPVYERAKKVWDNGKTNLHEVVLKDRRILKHLTSAEIKDVFHYDYHLKNVGEIFKRAGIAGKKGKKS